MGTWGVRPMENDHAMEWLSNEVDQPLCTAIKKALEGFLNESEVDEVRQLEAEAAAALLVDCTSGCLQGKYAPIALQYQASEQGLWDLGLRVIARIRCNAQWLSQWNDPAAKLRSLDELVSDLEATKRRFAPEQREQDKTAMSDRERGQTEKGDMRDSR